MTLNGWHSISHSTYGINKLTTPYRHAAKPCGRRAAWLEGLGCTECLRCWTHRTCSWSSVEMRGCTCPWGTVHRNDSVAVRQTPASHAVEQTLPVGDRHSSLSRIKWFSLDVPVSCLLLASSAACSCTSKCVYKCVYKCMTLSFSLFTPHYCIVVTIFWPIVPQSQMILKAATGEHWMFGQQYCKCSRSRASDFRCRFSAIPHVWRHCRCSGLSCFRHNKTLTFLGLYSVLRHL